MRKLFVLLLAFVSLRSSANQDACVALFAPTKHELEIGLAKEAGLHYSTQIGRGYSRKIENGITTYIDADGLLVTDAEIIARIAKLAIPPGYSNVWIAEDPLAHIQVRAQDSKARAQYRYHQTWNDSVLPEAKYSRMREFGSNISKLTEVANRDLKKSSIDRSSQLAAIVRLLEVSNIRIGTQRYADENGSFGLSTLKVHHVEIMNAKIRFQFVAKEGIPQDILVEDAEIARVISHLVENKSSEAKLFDVNAAEVNAYIKSSMGANFSAKDFRTWIGTTVAAETLHQVGFEDDEKKIAAAIKLACEAASSELHNTPAIAKRAYISPKIFDAYSRGELDFAFEQVIDPALSPAANAVLYLSNVPN